MPASSARCCATARTLAEERAIERRALELLDYVGIRARANDRAGSLPYGDQRRLEIARALATEPRLLALDEPAAGMNAAERLALGKLIRRIRDDGVTVLLIEHDVRLVMNVCDRVMVLDHGQKIAEGTPAKCSAIRRSSRPILERHIKRLSDARMLLELSQLEVRYGGIRAVTGVDLEVAEGELVCLIGANGAGKTSTLKAICGLVGSESGTIRYRGEDISHAPVHQLPRKGLVDGARRPRHLRRNLPWKRTWRWAPTRTAAPIRLRSTSAFRGSPSGASRSPARFPAASSRCSRSRAR